MRLIGHLSNEASATAFSDYLYVQGISNVVETEKDGWAIWIHSEDELPRAREMLEAFISDPQEAKYHKHARQARLMREQEVREEEAAEQRHFDRRRVFRSSMPLGVGPLTLALVTISVAIYLFEVLGGNPRWLELLYISRYTHGLPEIASGQVWRLVTPIFMHGGFLHIFFNMLWIFDLGTMIESRQGTLKLALLVLISAVLSNLGQWYTSGPLFLGMSGVVYALLGYIWMKGKFDPGSGLFLHPQTVTMMLIWFFLCLFNFIPGVANTAHAVGLVVGMVWGYFSSVNSTRNVD